MGLDVFGIVWFLFLHMIFVSVLRCFGINLGSTLLAVVWRLRWASFSSARGSCLLVQNSGGSVWGLKTCLPLQFCFLEKKKVSLCFQTFSDSDGVSHSKDVFFGWNRYQKAHHLQHLRLMHSASGAPGASKTRAPTSKVRELLRNAWCFWCKSWVHGHPGVQIWKTLLIQMCEPGDYRWSMNINDY